MANGKKKTNIVKGTTSSGLKFEIDPRIKDDARTLLYLTQMQDETLEPLEQSRALFRLLNMMFSEGIEDFMNEVAFRHDGVATIKTVTAELTEIFDAVKLKN